MRFEPTKDDKIARIIRALHNPDASHPLALGNCSEESTLVPESTDIAKVTEKDKEAFFQNIKETVRKNANIEEIARQAEPLLSSDASPESIDPDWKTSFSHIAGLYSNKEMQAKLSKILAAESNRRGSFSKRAFRTLDNLEKSDAEALQLLCNFSVFSQSVFTPVVFNIEDKIYSSNGLTYDSLLNLSSLGIIEFNNLSLNQITGTANHDKPNVDVRVRYAGKIICLAMVSTDREITLNIGQTLFTKLGKELSTLFTQEEIPEFIPYLLEQWKKYDAALLIEPTLPNAIKYKFDKGVYHQT